MSALCSSLLLAATLPVFKGYEAPRYQKHDKLIVRLVAEFNKERAGWAGATAEQGEAIGELTPEVVKAHMIQETGGKDAVSRAAWEIDPLQVNVPGDWNSYKSYLGLKKPRHRNEGSLETNLKAGIRYLVRKGFGQSGQPARNRSEGTFDGWHTSRVRYNGRTDLTVTGEVYSEVYAVRIEDRADNPKVTVPVEIKTP